MVGTRITTFDADVTAELRSRLYRMRGNPLPIYLWDDATLPAASLWSGARLVTREELEHLPPDTLQLTGPTGPEWLQRLVAGLFRGVQVQVSLHPMAARDPDEHPGARIVCLDEPLGPDAIRDDELSAMLAAPQSEELQLPARGWHRASVLRRVLHSLLGPAHVTCRG